MPLSAPVTRTPDPLNLEAAELVVPPFTLGARFTRTAMPCELGVDCAFTPCRDCTVRTEVGVRTDDGVRTDGRVTRTLGVDARVVVRTLGVDGRVARTELRAGVRACGRGLVTRTVLGRLLLGRLLWRVDFTFCAAAGMAMPSKHAKVIDVTNDLEAILNMATSFTASAVVPRQPGTAPTLDCATGYGA